MEEKTDLDTIAQTENSNNYYEQLCIEGFFDTDAVVNNTLPTDQ